MPLYPKAEQKKIKWLLKATKDKVMYRKYQVILLHMKGKTNTEIAEIVELHRKTVGIYVKQYTTNGIDSLIPKKPPGRPRFLSQAQEQQLYGTIKEKTPEEVGFDGIKNWTAKLACLWVLKEFGVQYQVNGMLDMFHRLKLSYTRPTYVIAKADPQKQEQFKENFEAVKKSC